MTIVASRAKTVQMNKNLMTKLETRLAYLCVGKIGDEFPHVTVPSFYQIHGSPSLPDLWLQTMAQGAIQRSNCM